MIFLAGAVAAILCMFCATAVFAQKADDGVELESQSVEERAEALYANESVMVSYSGHIQSIGWTDSKNNGERIGTVGCGKRLEALKIWVENIHNYSGQVLYRSHVQTYGWEKAWRADGEISGTVGESKRLEAVQIKLTGQLAEKYDIYYRVHVEQYGWLDWAKNGAIAGTSGYSKRIEAIEILVVDKGENVSGGNQYSYINSSNGISYTTHVQTYGWQDAKTNGAQAGSTGLSKRLEAIRINLLNCPYEGSVEYQSHVQTYGWETDWKRDGEKSGTEGKSKRLEAIRIRLTGELAEKCDIYYRVHCQHFGWLGWVKNGEAAGTAGFSYRMEAIQILLLPKDARSFPEEPGFIEKNGSLPSTPGELPGTGNDLTNDADTANEPVVIRRTDAFFTAHRGLSSQAPDNSIPAFRLAGESGFDSIETDIHETRDGVFLISHDGNLKDICGVDVNISDLTYAELADYDQYHIISGSNVERYSNFELRLPTLEEFLDICKEYGCIPQIDSKDLNSYESIKRLYAILTEYGVQDTAIVTAYNNLYLQSLRNLNPKITLAYGIDSAQYIDLNWAMTYRIGLSVSYTKLLSEDWQPYLSKGISVNAYTVRDRQAASTLIQQGITAITTDRILWDAAE